MRKRGVILLMISILVFSILIINVYAGGGHSPDKGCYASGSPPSRGSHDRARFSLTYANFGGYYNSDQYCWAGTIYIRIFEPDSAKAACECFSGSAWDSNGCCGDDTNDGATPFKRDDPDLSSAFCTNCFLGDGAPDDRSWDSTNKCCGDDLYDDCNAVIGDSLCWSKGDQLWEWRTASDMVGEIVDSNCGGESIIATGETDKEWLFCNIDTSKFEARDDKSANNIDGPDGNRGYGSNPTCPPKPPPPPKDDGGKDNEPAPSCFVAGTKIRMADSRLKNIENINIGEKVKGKNSINEVLGFNKHLVFSNQELYLINNKIKFTGDHLFLTEDGWKVADLDFYIKFQRAIDLKPSQLRVGDILITEKGKEVVKSIEALNQESSQTVYDLKLDGDQTYIAEGFIVHNCGVE